MEWAKVLGMSVHQNPPEYAGQESIPDREFYRPSEHGDWLYSPWMRDAGGKRVPELQKYLNAAESAGTAVSAERLYTLFTLARQALTVPGDFIETGVWRGGTALMFSKLMTDFAPSVVKQLHLFDTFRGMPETHEFDKYYKGGEFADTSLESVREKIGNCDFVRYYPGFVPDTFQGCESLKFAFAHIDLDIYQSILDACEFVYPRLVTGGVMVFDDYGWSTCPGARRAVDEYFADRKARPLVLSNGEAVVYKSTDES